MTKTRDMVRATLNAKAAEAFFGTELYHFQPSFGPASAGGAIDVVRASKHYSLPDEIADKVSIVEKLVRLPALRDGAKVIGNEAVAPSLRGNRKSGDDVFDSCDA